MYQIDGWAAVLKTRASWKNRQSLLPRVSQTVVLLGLTSFFTDISSEMVTAVLPLYLVIYLQLSPLQFGIVDGLYQGIAAIVRLIGGFSADRWRRYREVAAAGYGLSALCQLALVLVGGSWTAIATVVAFERLGKGLRTAPRDAMIAINSTTAGRATAFGVHRAMDTAGAMLGPIMAFGILAFLPGSFDIVFVASFCVAILGVGVISLLVPGSGSTADPAGPPPTIAEIVRPLREAGFLRLLAAGTLLSLATVSDAFIFLSFQNQGGFNAAYLPLFSVATSFSFLLMAIPCGWIADRIGRGFVFVAGYVLLGLVTLLVLFAGAGQEVLALAVLLLGAYYAATDGVLPALASTILPEDVRASGLAALNTATTLGRLVASITFGALWTLAGLQVAISGFLGAMLLSIVFAAVALRQSGPRVSYE